mgnify:CR=1 FL=1
MNSENKTSEKELRDLIEIAVAAGAEILDVYNSSDQPDVSLKDDSSPLTDADRRAHQLIVSRLQALYPDIPVLSEESDAIDTQERLSWRRFWLVDPLDGTKEFVSRNGEFTVNIALIENGVAELGIVHVPVSGISYAGRQGIGAWKLNPDNSVTELKAAAVDGEQPLRVVASRNHRGELLDALIERLEAHAGEVEVVSMGSSLKICLLAEGKADFYPRLAPTSEWDTAAAHAVLAAAGGEIVDTQFQALKYNQKADVLNPHFLALADQEYPWAEILAELLV